MTVLVPNQREEKGTGITRMFRILVGKRNSAEGLQVTTPGSNRACSAPG
jgi:hypothetical protein